MPALDVSRTLHTQAERGWPEKRAAAALEKNGWVVEAAIKYLQQ